MPALPPPAPPTDLVAYGVTPSWQLSRRDGRWTLVERGRPPIGATELGRRLTRRGTVLGARRADGRIISIVIAPGLCALSPARRPAAYVATLMIDGRALPGCYIAPVPGERPMLD